MVYIQMIIKNLMVISFCVHVWVGVCVCVYYLCIHGCIIMYHGSGA